jgi:hypothetical protein
MCYACVQACTAFVQYRACACVSIDCNLGSDASEALSCSGVSCVLFKALEFYFYMWFIRVYCTDTAKLYDAPDTFAYPSYPAGLVNFNGYASRKAVSATAHAGGTHH